MAVMLGVAYAAYSCGTALLRAQADDEFVHCRAPLPRPIGNLQSPAPRRGGAVRRTGAPS
jgi:hypothetical protein